MKKLLLLALLFSSSLFAQSPPKGIWLTPTEIATLPTEGKAWESLKTTALGSWSTPDLSNQDSKANVQVWAGALYAVRTGHIGTRDRVRAAVAKIPSTLGGRTLALGRELPAYVMAIDLVGWESAAKETAFKDWLRKARITELDGKTLISTHEVRPNNWGTQAAFARAVIAVYLGDTIDLQRCAIVHRGWLGDRAAYSDKSTSILGTSAPGFEYGDLSWQADRANPVGINPKGSLISGHSVDGVLPEEMRRSGGFEWEPPCENYVWTGMTPALCASWVLSRWGYPDVFTWSDSAQLRAIKWQYLEADCPATGNDVGTVWLVNAVYGTTFGAGSPTEMSREIWCLDWTHARPWGPVVDPDPDPVPDDFMANFSFGYLVTSKSWTVNINPANGFKPGAGGTPNAALADWLTKNPNGF
jgi:hypothetical protein